MSVAPLHPLKLDPTRRLAELAGVAYLASPEARGITGTALTIDGGFNI